jgi:hypothetical protein
MLVSVTLNQNNSCIPQVNQPHVPSSFSVSTKFFCQLRSNSTPHSRAVDATNVANVAALGPNANCRAMLLQQLPESTRSRLAYSQPNLLDVVVHLHEELPPREVRWQHRVVSIGILQLHDGATPSWLRFTGAVSVLSSSRRACLSCGLVRGVRGIDANGNSLQEPHQR